MFWPDQKTENLQADANDDDVVAVDEWFAASREQEDFRCIEMVGELRKLPQTTDIATDQQTNGVPSKEARGRKENVHSD
jgi:hypothetical protein